jgi:hypothetical protein
MPKFRRKPVVIEAVQYEGTEMSIVEILEMKGINTSIRVDAGDLLFHNPNGLMRAKKGNWIVKEENGELYRYKPDVFDQSFERLE